MSDELFSEIIVCVQPSAGSGKQKKPQLEELFSKHGATTSKTITKKVTHVCCSADDSTAAVTKARAAGGDVKFVTAAFFIDSIALGKLQNEDDYLAEVKEEKKEDKKDENEDKKADDDEEEKPAARPKRKRGAATVDPDDDDDAADVKPPPAKRARKAAEPKPEPKPEPAAAPAAPALIVTKTVVKKGSVPVDPDANLSSTCHVYEDDSGAWSCVLNQTNIANNNNKFYNIQLLESDDKRSYYVFTKWGRVGLDGQTKTFNSGTLAAAKADFNKKYKDKTGQLWMYRASFTTIPGKYTLIDIDYGAADANKDADKEKKDAVDAPDSTLDARVQTLIKLICNVNTMKEQLLEMNFDLNKMPLGKLGKATLEKASKVLGELEEAINNKAKKAVLVDLSNQFYTLVPHYFGMRTPPTIDSSRVVSEKMKMLEELGYMEIATKLLEETSGDSSENPIDREYKALKAEISPIDKNDETYKLIEKYVKQTHGKTHTAYDLEIKNIFRIARQGEEDRFKDKSSPGNHMLLWHGSRVTNFVGILSQGLRIAPPEAPVTGYMFGKGIYFADMVSKSANYCHARKDHPDGLALLCEVAIGKPAELKQAQNHLLKAPAGCDSTKGIGSTHPNPSEALKDPEAKDCTIPLGKGVPSGVSDASLLYNEYIVYRTDQVKMRYLVHFDFKFKY